MGNPRRRLWGADSWEKPSSCGSRRRKGLSNAQSRGNTQFFFFISFFSSPFPHTLLHSLSHSLTPISTLKKYERGEPYYSLIGVPVVREGEPHICCSFLSVSSHAVSGRVQQSRVKRAPTSWSESLRKHQETRKHQGDDGQSGTLETDVISCL